MADPASPVYAALARWRAALSDPSPRNPLLHLRPGLDVPPADAAALFGRLTQPGKSTAVTGAQPEQLAALRRRAQTGLEEHGVRLLHLAGGVLEWADPDTAAPLRSPLVILPVELAAATVTAAGTPFVNPLLQTRLQAALDLRLPPLPSRVDEKTLPTFFAEVQTVVAGLGWSVEPAALLTLLPVFTEPLERDLAENEALLADHPLVRVLAGAEPAATLALPDARELDAAPQPALHILDADSSQRLALAAAMRGHSFVLQAPPGTAQAQAMANLAAERIGGGQSVLIVSPRPAQLAEVARLLRDAGLGDFVLDLAAAGADSRAVVNELRRCLEQPPTPAGGPSPQELEQLRQYRDQLNAYADALHRVREPLQRSAWWALGEVARCHAAARLELGEFNALDITPTWLDEARHAIERAQHFWHLHEQGDSYLWHGFKSGERYTLKLRDDVLHLIDKVRGRLDRLQTVADHYAAAIGASGPIPWLLRASELLETNPHPPAAWLQGADTAALATDLERCAASYQQRGQSRQPLTERYGPALWKLPEGTAEQVEHAWHAAAPLLAADDTQGAGLLRQQQKLRGWAAETLKRLPHWLTDARALEKWLAVELPPGASDAAAGPEGKHDPSPHTLRRLQRLANLCMSETPPERAWVTDPQALAKAQALIASVGPVFADNHRRRHELLTRYKEQLFELDVVYLAERYRGPYASWLRVFSMQYRRDRRALQRRSHGDVLPRSVREDVFTAAAVVGQRRQLDAERPARLAVLGRYEKGMDTDFDAAEKATRVAAEALELARELGCETLPDRLVDALSATTPAAEKIRAAAKRLHDALGPWLHATEELEALLPSERLPGTGAPLLDSALSAVNHYAKDLQTTLNHFAALTDPALAHAPAPPPDAVALVADLRQAELLRGAEEAQPADAARWTERFGPAFHGVNTDWAALRKQITWAGRVRELFGAAGKPAEQFVQLATAPGTKPPSSQELKQAREQVEHALHSLELRFEPPGPRHGGKRLAELAPEELRQHLKLLHDRVAELAEWIEWRQLADRFAHLGLAAFWQEVQKQRPPREQLADCLQHSVLHRWLEAVFAQDAALGQFDRKEHERVALEFRALDRKLQTAAAAAVAHRADQGRTELGKEDVEAAALRREAAKKDALPPLRTILDELPHLLPRLKPCVLATPLTAVRLLDPREFGFDLVVIGEAHRLSSGEALPAVARGKQAIVIGDEHLPADTQLVPHLLGVTADEPTPSLLDCCLRVGVLALTLRWQEPGRPLGDFANALGYDEVLYVLPAATDGRGAVLRPVESAVYEEVGGNAAEAQAVVESVVREWKTAGGKKSIGVGAFDRDQLALIMAELERRLQQQPELEALARQLPAEGATDRDIFVLSVGYGRDAAGQLPADFGPLSQEDGQRWVLAVALAAREKLVVVSALKARDLAEVKEPAEGVRALAALLAYAETGASPGGPQSPNAAGALPRDVAAEVQRLGYRATVVEAAAPCGGNVFVHEAAGEGRRVLAVLCDGAGYQDLPAARDRERLLPEALERLGWRLHRVWGPDWWRRRAEEVERLKQALEAGKKPLAPPPPPPPAAKPAAPSAGQGPVKRLDSKPKHKRR